MELKPLQDRIVAVRRQRKEEVTSGGIVIPDTHQRRPEDGTVVSVGPDVQNVATEDHIFWATYAGYQLLWQEKEYVVIREEEVLCREAQ